MVSRNRSKRVRLARVFRDFRTLMLHHEVCHLYQRLKPASYQLQIHIMVFITPLLYLEYIRRIMLPRGRNANVNLLCSNIIQEKIVYFFLIIVFKILSLNITDQIEIIAHSAVKLTNLV